MTQITTGIRSVLSSASIYQFVQNLLGGKRSCQSVVDTYIRPSSGLCILDVGCGPGKILTCLPEDIRYIGVDLSADYIQHAKAEYGHRGQFINSDLKDLDFSLLEHPNIVLATGLLHHLNDAEVLGLFHQIKAIMADGARLVTLDPCWIAGANPIAHLVISLDRGQNVRTPDAYHQLATSVFQDVHIHLRNDLLRIPYNHIIMECGMSTVT